MAKIDVIVPCYNYARFLHNCVTSILEQSIQDVRVLIIDDASQDNTLAVAESLAESDSRVSTISHSQNQGLIYTCNEGIAWASADYMLILSADDLLAAGAFERAIAILDAHPDIGFVYGRCIEFGEGLAVKDPGVQLDYTWDRHEGFDFIHSMCASACCYINTPTVIVRTSVQKAVGGYSSHLPHTSDMEMWLRLATHGAVAGIGAVQGLWRSHGTNMSKPCFDERYPDFKNRKEAFDSFFAAYSDHLQDAKNLQSQVNRTLAEDAFWTAIGLICRGQGNSGRKLLHFAFELQPGLRYWPPFSHLLQIPNLPDKVITAIGMQFAKIIGRPVKPWDQRWKKPTGAVSSALSDEMGPKH